MREVIFYKTSTGHSPIDDFLNALDSKQAKKVAWVLNLVEELEVVPKQYFKKMTNTKNLWEVRVRLSSNIFRFLCFFDGSKIVILAHAFQKKTLKTPRQAIKLAEERMNDLLENYEE